MTVRVSVAAGGVELRPDPNDRAAVRAALRGLDPPVRTRTLNGAVVVGFDDAERAIEAIGGVQVGADVRRAVANRRRQRTAATIVRAEERRRSALDIAEVRALIADSDLEPRLDDHQARNVAVMTVDGGWGTAVFDEQGTGKTVTTIAAFDVLAERDEAEVLVVVCPKTMLGEWAAEFHRFVSHRYRVLVVDGPTTTMAPGYDVVVLNYEAVVRLRAQLRLLARRSKVALVVDESFLVKNPEAARTRAVTELREWCTRCYVLCGTPAPNKPHDLVTQFDLVDFGYTFDNVQLDDDRDIAAGQVRRVLDDERSHFARNLKDDVLPDLPSRTFSDVKVELAPLQAHAYDSALTDLIVDLSQTNERAFARDIRSFLERRQALLRICCDPTPIVPGYDELPAKVAALDELLDDLVAQRGEKVTLWSFYRSSLERLARRYAHHGLVRVDGSVDPANRREAVRRFQNDDDVFVFLANPAAAGAGLTLHAARYAIYESMSNQAAHYMQSLDRIHRRGQARPVEYFTLIATDTVEESECATLRAKAQRQADLLGDGDTLPTRQVLLDELLAARRQRPTR